MKSLVNRLFSLKNSSLWLIFSSVIYCLAGFLGQSLFSLQPSNITLIWLPSGIALVMLLSWRLKALVYIFLASLVVNSPGMYVDAAPLKSLMHICIAALGDMLAPALGFLLLQAFLPSGTRNASDLLKFVLLAGVIPVLLSSLWLSVNLAAGDYIPWASLPTMAQLFFFADILGILLVYQIYSGWLEPQAWVIGRWRHIALPIIGLPTFYLVGIYLDLGWLFYLIPPLLVVLAFELTRFYLGLLSSLSLLFIILATAHGFGVFVGETQAQTNTEMMAFVLSCALTLFGISLQHAQLHRSERDKLSAEKEAQLDPLSGLFNRRSFKPLLQALEAKAKAQSTFVCVAMLDIDNFKAINDTHGHSVGDRVIQSLAQILHNNCRSDDIAARLGGEEFALVLGDIGLEQAQPVLERIRSSFVDTPIAVAGDMIHCSVSIGLVENSQTAGIEPLLQLADKALYRAKRQGKNRIVCFEAQ
ncbi:diguanylate cyclase [Shewanella sp. AS16]|uniref:sensor domain-containing diguanylate cyclase n=1 Tax=Shewanella sp. AS16 TaxID=2907625 RepID=UPI001F24F24F|nr:diguanylate cyclase [Shewanella sp. AS16]MCE9688254.1 diguanylate cyclase [Shewanella sp. AS16]